MTNNNEEKMQCYPIGALLKNLDGEVALADGSELPGGLKLTVDIGESTTEKFTLKINNLIEFYESDSGSTSIQIASYLDEDDAKAALAKSFEDTKEELIVDSIDIDGSELTASNAWINASDGDKYSFEIEECFLEVPTLGCEVKKGTELYILVSAFDGGNAEWQLDTEPYFTIEAAIAGLEKLYNSEVKEALEYATSVEDERLDLEAGEGSFNDSKGNFYNFLIKKTTLQ